MTDFNQSVHLYKAELERLDEPVWFVSDTRCRKPLHKLYQKVVDELDSEPDIRGFGNIDGVRVEFYVLEQDEVANIIDEEENYIKRIF